MYPCIVRLHLIYMYLVCILVSVFFNLVCESYVNEVSFCSFAYLKRFFCVSYGLLRGDVIFFIIAVYLGEHYVVSSFGFSYYGGARCCFFLFSKRCRISCFLFLSFVFWMCLLYSYLSMICFALIIRGLLFLKYYCVFCYLLWVLILPLTFSFFVFLSIFFWFETILSYFYLKIWYLLFFYSFLDISYI